MSNLLEVDKNLIFCQNVGMVKATDTTQDEARRKEILDAALYCFLHFGYSKTSMDDVAKRAGLSRPLIYLKYKNKEDLFLGLFDHVAGSCVQESESILEDHPNLTTREKLLLMCEVLVIGPYSRIQGYPMSDEFFNTCGMCCEKTFEKFQKQKLKLSQEILGDKGMGEVFAMALSGIKEDLPSVNVLKKRVELLVDKFAKD